MPGATVGARVLPPTLQNVTLPLDISHQGFRGRHKPGPTAPLLGAPWCWAAQLLTLLQVSPVNDSMRHHSATRSDTRQLLLPG